MNARPGPAVSVRALAAQVAGRRILTGVEFDVAAGEITVLCGPSGAGKSTIAAAVADLDRPGIRWQGKILVDGRPEDRASRVGHLPQHAPATLNPARRVGHLLDELLRLHDVEASQRSGPRPRSGRQGRRSRVAQVLRMAGFDPPERDLPGLLRRFPHQFSGGERTRLALAQVLAGRPRVLVLDEPTAGLDPSSQERLFVQLETLRAAGLAILLVTHHRAAAARLADRTVSVRDGRVVGYERASTAGLGTGSGSGVTKVPSTPEPSASQPSAFEPSASRPSASQPSASEPSVSRPSANRPTERDCPRSPVPVARWRAVEVRIRGTELVRDIDLDLRHGEMLGMVGASGAGKSTIARSLAGLVQPTRGAVLVGGNRFPPLGRRTRDQLAAVQYIWQESAASFEPRRPVLDQVAATAARLRGSDRHQARRQALAILASLEIDEAQSMRYPIGLSGGQLQRAAVARALLAEPSVLLCDEVTTGLDEPLSRRILDTLRAYQGDTGAAILLIGHDIPLMLRYADRIAVVERGRIVQLGSPTLLD